MIPALSKNTNFVSGVGRAVTHRASNLKVRGSTLGLDEIFVRCFSVFPTYMESEKTEKTLSVMLEVALVVNSLLLLVTRLVTKSLKEPRR